MTIMNQLVILFYPICVLNPFIIILSFVLSVGVANSQSDHQAAFSNFGELQTRHSDLPLVRDAIICDGDIDFFACPPESTIRDTAIVNMMRSKFDSNDCYKFLDFDEIPWRTNCTSTPVGFFIHKISYSPGSLYDASIEVSLRAATKNEPNSDFIAFFQGKDMIAGSMIRDLPGANGTWNPNQSATFTLNLKNLPSTFGFTNMLPYMTDGDIDVVVGNETGVDYVCLNLIAISKVLDLKVLIQGRFTSPDLSLPDTMSVNLRSATFPYNLIESSAFFPDSTGISSIEFFNAQNGVSYWIQINHRNSVEAWSSTPVSFSNDLLTFGFTSSASQAYGGNLIEVATGIFAIYSGDVNQDGTVDATDIAMIDNDAANFVAGYVETDLTGDGFVDATDLTIADNNAYNFVGVIRP